MDEPDLTPTEEKTGTEAEEDASAERRWEAFDRYAPALKSPAVALCCQAWQGVLAAALLEKKAPRIAKRLASIAYCASLPPVVGYENICDFIACVTYGISFGAIKAEMGTKLLYGAQIALSTLAPAAKTEKRRPFYSIPVEDIPYYGKK